MSLEVLQSLEMSRCKTTLKGDLHPSELVVEE